MTTTLLNIDLVNNHRKFYTVTVDGPTVRLAWGRIGTAGQVKVERFVAPQAAVVFGRQKIAAKLDRGYERMVA